MNAIPLRRDVHYPESDGQPMGESELHQQEMIYLIEALRDHFRATADVYVAGNLFLYYREGDPQAVVAPDLFVVQGVRKHKRRTYKLWQEGKAPCLVVEVTSESSREDDLGKRMRVYERLGVEEYFLFDPQGDYLSPRLQGYRLVSGRYRRAEPSADGSLHSRATGITLVVVGEEIRLCDSATGEPILRNEEVRAGFRGERAARQTAEKRAAHEAAARRTAEERAAHEAAARQAAEERARALEEELVRLRAARSSS